MLFLFTGTEFFTREILEKTLFCLVKAEKGNYSSLIPVRLNTSKGKLLWHKLDVSILAGN